MMEPNRRDYKLAEWLLDAPPDWQQSAQWVLGQEEYLRFGEDKEQTDKGCTPSSSLFPRAPLAVSGGFFFFTS